MPRNRPRIPPARVRRGSRCCADPRAGLRQRLAERRECRLELALVESHVADLLQGLGTLEHFPLGTPLTNGREIAHGLGADRVEQLELPDPLEVLAQVAEHVRDQLLRLRPADIGFAPGVHRIQRQADGQRRDEQRTRRDERPEPRLSLRVPSLERVDAYVEQARSDPQHGVAPATSGCCHICGQWFAQGIARVVLQ